MMNEIIENRFVGQLVSQFRRSPAQSNRLHETDAEIIRVSDDLMLALTTDSIAEEISLGLYADPYLIGWMTVMANLSDLAAVGAKPLGLLISEILPTECDEEFLNRLQQGIQAACNACGTFVLGGDTNTGPELALTGTAVGVCSNRRYLSRIGLKSGDAVYSTGLLGIGNAYALSTFDSNGGLAAQMRHRFFGAGNQGDTKTIYQPIARLTEGQSINGLATSCMDTSDGVLSTLDQLMRLNSVGFRFNRGWENCLHPIARQVAGTSGLPPWLFLAGQHGEFELLFTILQETENQLNEAAKGIGWKPALLGIVTETPKIELPLYGDLVALDTARIRNLPSEVGNNVGEYVNRLLLMDTEIRKGAENHA